MRQNKKKFRFIVMILPIKFGHTSFDESKSILWQFADCPQEF